ncbi:MAG TPA: hypothetical protein P5136_02585 [Methanofastidiosum sp.]|nr:hypothetical protein [Methanofastidiosum sp.]
MKKVGGTKYVHYSALNQLSAKDNIRVSAAFMRIPNDFKYVIIAISKEQIDFIACDEWNDCFEPVVGDRYVVKGRDVFYRKANQAHPLIFHKRYLFVNPNYKGFDYRKDKKRGEFIDRIPNLNKKMIGRLEYWFKIMEKFDIPT